VRIGIVGAAGIAEHAMVVPARAVDDVEIAAIAARDPARAEAFARRNGIAVVHPSYQSLVEDGSLDAVYVPLANSLHAQWTIAALEAGRHVLCEKPFASNAAQAEEMVALAERRGLVLVEAMHWRYHPVAERMIDLSKQIGPLQHVEANFRVQIPRDNIRFDYSLAGGSFMDLGSYCMHMVRTVVGTEPTVVKATAVEGPPGIDASMEAELSLNGVEEASVSSSMLEERTIWPEAMAFRAVGSSGDLEVLNPMAPQIAHRIRASLADGSTVDETMDVPTSYVYQLRAFYRAVVDRKPPLTGGADAVANMRAIDAVYVASGLGPRH
jgi:predicted dehydrogenase